MSEAALPVANLRGVSHAHGKTLALAGIDLAIPAGRMVGLIGPDGVGKSTLLSLISGARQIQKGHIDVLGGDIASPSHRSASYSRIAYMPQGLGRNLYPTLSIRENVDFFGRLFGLSASERATRIEALLGGTGLLAFSDRQAVKLSGGMKQKLGLCCALIHDPDLLILDEPTTGVDPLSRRQFWELIAGIRRDRPGMSVIVATAYMEEAARFDHLVAMDAGHVLDAGSPSEIMQRTRTTDLDSAFIALLPPEKRKDHSDFTIPPRKDGMDGSPAIEAEHLTMRFGDFTAVDDVNFRIMKGEIFGFLGSNGCGKSTTMKMMTGLLAASEGTSRLFGEELRAGDMEARRRVGYMSQSFSLYSELSVRQNLELHARLFSLPPAEIRPRIDFLARKFDLAGLMDEFPEALPLGIRQRLSLAVAMIHSPDILILDEPTSGVDPVARDGFWQFLVELSRKDGVTIFISTHFMNEAERCDRISLMHAGRVLMTDTPQGIVSAKGTADLEAAFIACLEEAMAGGEKALPAEDLTKIEPAAGAMASGRRRKGFSLARMLSYSHREMLELRRDPVRATLAVLGTLILMFVIGYGTNLDVENLSFAVMDRDESVLSRDYALALSGSRYFEEKAPVSSYEELDRRMKEGDISLAIEIPPGFGRDIARGSNVEIGAWIDGSMPTRGETIEGYVQGIHANWLAEKAREIYGDAATKGTFTLETRFRYNPDIRSLVAMVPAVIPLLLLMIPAMLTALSVVREKELGSIVNLYVTPVSRTEFLIGKQLPYIVIGLMNFFLLIAFAVFGFKVPFSGSLPAFTLGALVYVGVSTALGLLISTFMNSQIAAIFSTALITLVPSIQYSGMIDPVSSLKGMSAVIGNIYPTTYFMVMSRGAFSKGLGLGDLAPAFVPLLIALPVLLVLAIVLLRKQAR